jgi:hypothetical protein
MSAHRKRERSAGAAPVRLASSRKGLRVAIDRAIQRHHERLGEEVAAREISALFRRERAVLQALPED